MTPLFNFRPPTSFESFINNHFDGSIRCEQGFNQQIEQERGYFEATLFGPIKQIVIFRPVMGLVKPKHFKSQGASSSTPRQECAAYQPQHLPIARGRESWQEVHKYLYNRFGQVHLIPPDVKIFVGKHILHQEPEHLLHF